MFFPKYFLLAVAVFYLIQAGLDLWGMICLVASAGAGAKLAPRSKKENLQENQAELGSEGMQIRKGGVPFP